MKVLLINPLIPHYRIPIFNLLSREMDLTIMHSGSIVDSSECNFHQVFIPITQIGPFLFHRARLRQICNEYDVVISDSNIRHVDRYTLMFSRQRSFGWVSWGIGLSASYKNILSQKSRFDIVRFWIQRHADAQVFYSEYPVQKYLEAGFNREDLFVANNTVEVLYEKNKEFTRNSFLFVGTLYRAKGIFVLLESYFEYLRVVEEPILLQIVGDGEDRESIETWINSRGLNNLVILNGSITCERKLQKFFREAYACISPGQAGLSVLKSMGYGTPFVTSPSAFTGGEIYNIKDKVNGRLFSSKEDLYRLLVDVHENPQRYEAMGINARRDYVRNASPEEMVASIVAATHHAFESRSSLLSKS